MSNLNKKMKFKLIIIIIIIIAMFKLIIITAASLLISINLILANLKTNYLKEIKLYKNKIILTTTKMNIMGRLFPLQNFLIIIIQLLFHSKRNKRKQKI